MNTEHIREGGLEDPRVVRLLDTHVRNARAQTAPGSAHALDLAALRAPAIRFWSYWREDDVLGVVALKRLSATHGEVKSMYTAPDARCEGVGSALLQHVVAQARGAGMTRLSLETGSWDYFAPARKFYRSHGFADCAVRGICGRPEQRVSRTRHLKRPPRGGLRFTRQ